MNRREFLKCAFLAGVPVPFGDYDFLKDYGDYRSIRPIKNNKFARIVSCSDAKCVTGNYAIDAERAANLVRKALLEYTRRQTVKDAVRSLFPVFKESLRVSIKINTASWGMPSHRVVAETLSACLVEGGLKPDNIIIWERAEKTLRGGGYAPRTGKGLVKILATDTKGYGYDERSRVKIGDTRVYLTYIITRHSDCLINIGVMKHHFITGITGTMKNMYGAMPLLDEPIMAGPLNLVKFHLNGCDPYIGELNAAVAHRVPTVLYVCDALVGSWSGGPWGPPQWIQNEILLGNDPVALDTISLYRVEAMRKRRGLSPVLARSGHIRTAAAIGLGTNNPGQIEMIHSKIE